MTMNLLKLIDNFDVKTFIFSSSATVYGAQDKVFIETDRTGNDITNPYGKSKYMQEEIIKDYSKISKKTNFIILRYFNPIGAHESGYLQENPKNRPNNLMPILLKVVNKEKGYQKLQIYGNDYNTEDGTCERDFIHVMDLANAHILALQYNNVTASNLEIFNIGTSNSISVLTLVETFQSVNQIKIPYVFSDRRNGDIPRILSDCSKASSLLNFRCEKSVEDMCRDSYNSLH